MIIFAIVFFVVMMMFFRATMITLGYYKEPVLAAFQQYGEEVGFSPLLEMLLWGGIVVYLLFLSLVPSSTLIMFGLVTFTTMFSLYWRVREKIMNYPHLFLQYPRWYREIVEHTSREERRKISYMWLGLPFRTRLLYNTRQDAFERWVELVVISVA